MHRWVPEKGCQLKKLRLKSLRFLDTAAPHYAKSRAFDLTHLFPGSSVVERRTVNPLVAGSSPARGATSYLFFFFFFFFFRRRMFAGWQRV